MKKSTAPIPFAGSRLDQERHGSAFFNNADEQYQVLLPFIKDGFPCFAPPLPTVWESDFPSTPPFLRLITDVCGRRGTMGRDVDFRLRSSVPSRSRLTLVSIGLTLRRWPHNMVRRSQSGAKQYQTTAHARSSSGASRRGEFVRLVYGVAQGRAADSSLDSVRRSMWR